MLTADNGTKIHLIETEQDIIDAFFSKMVSNYGLTGGGKTYVSDTILESLGLYIPKLIFYSATEHMNGNYLKMAPRSTIFTTFDLGKFKKDVEFQGEVCGLWRTANEDFEVMKSISDKVYYNTDTNSKILKLDDLNELDEEMKKKIKVAKSRLYKNNIFEHQSGLKNLNEDEITIVKRMDTNPCMGIIVDDFAAEVDQASKSKTQGQEFFRSLAYNCRHYKLTCMFMLQNIDALDSKMRRNVQTNIFSTPNEARSYFKNSTNAFSAEAKKESEYVISKLEKMGGYRVLVYCRDNTNGTKRFNYMIGKQNAKPVMCSQTLRDICREIEKPKEDVLVNKESQFLEALV
jgi:hypothetical protein